MEKRFLEDCLAQGMSLEAIGKQAGKHPSTVSYWLKKHGLTAAGKARHAPKGTVDLTRLSELVESGMSFRQIAEKLGIGYSTVRYWVKRLGLETDRMARRREGDAARAAGLRRLTSGAPNTVTRRSLRAQTAVFAVQSAMSWPFPSVAGG